MSQLNEDEEPPEGLPDAELDSHTSDEARTAREAVIEHERRLRQSQH